MADPVGDPGRHGHGGDAGGADQRVDRRSGEQVHDLAHQHAGRGADGEGHDAQHQDAQRGQAEELIRGTAWCPRPGRERWSRC